jgi:Zn-finger nucleic acid-binding protein
VEGPIFSLQLTGWNRLEFEDVVTQTAHKISRRDSKQQAAEKHYKRKKKKNKRFWCGGQSTKLLKPSA